MKNFRTLYLYELKKLLKRKLPWIMVLVTSAFMVYDAYQVKYDAYHLKDYDDGWFSLTDQAGNAVSEHLSGAEQRRLIDEGARRVSGQIMDESLFQKVRQASTGNGQYVVQDMWEQESYFYLIDNTYYAPYGMVTHKMGLDPTITTADSFYAHRQYSLETNWAELTDREAAYWKSMEAQVEKPFVYCYAGGYQDILVDILALSMLIPIVVACCLCGVFSEEKRTRADALVLSSRYGRFPQYWAKVLAGITVASAATLSLMGANVAFVLLARGWDGFDAALQLGNLSSSLPITVGQATLILLGLLFLYGLLCSGVTMLFSVFAQNTVIALSAPILLMLCQGWLRLDIQAVEYLPDQLFNSTVVLRNVNLVNFFGVYLNNLQFGFILYGGLAVMLIALCWLGWRRSAAGRI